MKRPPCTCSRRDIVERMQREDSAGPGFQLWCPLHRRYHDGDGPPAGE